MGDLLAALPGKAKAGVEISPHSREIVSASGLDVRSALKDFAGRRFSRVISSHAFEHIPNPASVLEEIRDYLEPDGLLILLVPLLDWRRISQRRWRPDPIHLPLYTWTPAALGNLLSVIGFLPVSVRVLTHAHPPRIGDALGRWSPVAYHPLAKLAGFLLLRRQLIAIARLESPAAGS